LLGIRESKNRGDGESVDKLRESGYSGVVPDEIFTFLGEFKKRFGNVRVILDEATVKVAKAKEGLDLGDCTGARPIGDSGEFCRVHFNLTLSDNNAKILDGGLVEEALLRLEIEVGFGEA
jgi:hypothetical protein